MCNLKVGFTCCWRGLQCVCRPHQFSLIIKNKKIPEKGKSVTKWKRVEEKGWPGWGRVGGGRGGGGGSVVARTEYMYIRGGGGGRY
jgi:hypothetical protein